MGRGGVYNRLFSDSIVRFQPVRVSPQPHSPGGGGRSRRAILAHDYEDALLHAQVNIRKLSHKDAPHVQNSRTSETHQFLQSFLLH